MWAITDYAVPVIGAINGPALGAGLAYAACCDLLVAADTATFGTTEINVGLLGASAHLPAPRRPAQGPRDVLHRGNHHGRGAAPPRCRARGRAARTPDGHRRELATTLAAKSPIALRLAKESMNRVEDLSLKEGYRTEQEYTARLLRFEDAREARAAFLDRRDPDWKWR